MYDNLVLISSVEVFLTNFQTQLSLEASYEKFVFYMFNLLFHTDPSRARLFL